MSVNIMAASLRCSVSMLISQLRPLHNRTPLQRGKNLVELHFAVAVSSFGANEATIFETDKDIKVDGKTLKAGKYSLYAVPGEKEWTYIFNSQTGQWGVKMDGSTTEDPAKDVLRVTAKPKKSKSFNERMAYVVDKDGFALVWENLEVPVSVK